MRAEVAAGLGRYFAELEARGRVPAADTDALLLTVAFTELADGDLRGMLAKDDLRLLDRALERLACGCVAVAPRLSGDTL